MSATYARPRSIAHLCARTGGVVLASAGLTLLAGCGEGGGTEPDPDPDPDPDPVTVATVTVTPDTATLTAIGDTLGFSAEAKDADGNVMSDVTFGWTSSDTTIAKVDAAGLATARGSGEATITATAEGVPGSATVVVDQAIAGLAFRTQPTGTDAGAAISPAVEVAVRDSAGSVVSDASIAITLELADTSGGARLLGTTTVNASNGVASFSGLSVERADTAHAIVATSPGVPEATSATFAVTPLDAVDIAYISPPAEATAGDPLGIEVAFRDTYGNIATAAADTVTIALADTAGGGVLVGETTAAAAAGVALFDAVAIERADTGYTVAASAPGVDTIISPPFAIRATAPHHIGSTLEAGIPSAVAEQAVSGLEYAVMDTFGNVVDTASASMAIELRASAFPGATMNGQLTESAVDGVAVFDSVRVDRPGAHQVAVTSAGFAEVVDTVIIILFPAAAPQIEAGSSHTCIPTNTGPFCWGWNGEDQLGAPYTVQDSVAVPANSDRAFIMVGTGDTHTCGTTGLDDGYTIYCWGGNDYGQLGIGGTGGTMDSPTAVQDPVGRPASYDWISAGGRHTCALGSDRFAYCWGYNAAGQLGDGNQGVDSDSVQLVNDTLPLLMIAAGRLHTCGVGAADSLAYCWGANDYGQLGDGNSPTGSDTPVLVDSTKYIYVDAGAYHSCAVRAVTGDIDCWGRNDQGQLGDGNQGVDSDVPVPTTANVDLADDGNAYGRLSLGSNHACAVVTGPGGAAGIECWGDNLDGQLGNGGTGTDSDVPVPVDMSAFEAADPNPPMVFWWVAAGDGHSCTFEYDPTDSPEGYYIPGLTGFYCWGRNDQGQLGDGTTSDSPTPVRPVQGH